MELLLFLATGVLLPPIVWCYLRYAEPRGVRHEAFEAWCRTGPLVVAFHCPKVGAKAALAAVREGLPRGLAMTNHEGGFPFPHYALSFEARLLGDRVVGLFVTRGRVLRGIKRPTFVLDVVRTAAERLGGDLDELWLHGWMHAEASEEPTDERSFRARPTTLELRAYRDLPFWLRQHDGPIDRRREKDQRTVGLFGAVEA